eukprot:COSAG01_NODE_894_length_12903_cov_865.702353_10_plen_50_part_01
MLRQPVTAILAWSVLFVLLNNSSIFSQSNWPRFRGANGAGLVDGVDLPSD